MGGSDAASEREALQEALEAEHAAVYAYAVVGAVLGGDDTQAQAAYAVHRDRRDALIAMIGAEAVPAEPAYDLPFEVAGPAPARRLAARVEQRCATVYAHAVARTTARNRAYAARALTDCAVRGLIWGNDPEPFPGLRNP